MSRSVRGASCQLCREPIAEIFESVRLPRLATYPSWLSFMADATVHRTCLQSTPFLPDLLKAWGGWWESAGKGAEIRFEDSERLLFIHRTGAGFTYVYHPRFLVLQGDDASLADLALLLRDGTGRSDFPFGVCEVTAEPPDRVLRLLQSPAGPVTVQERFTPEEWEHFTFPFRAGV
ncbi:MAG: hypothetical protein ACOY94_00355 [Bacillota bacterium]